MLGGLLHCRRIKIFWEILTCFNVYFRESDSRLDISVQCVVSQFRRVKYVKDGVRTISQSFALEDHMKRRVLTAQTKEYTLLFRHSWSHRRLLRGREHMAPQHHSCASISHHGQCMLRFMLSCFEEKHFRSHLILDFENNMLSSFGIYVCTLLRHVYRSGFS